MKRLFALFAAAMVAMFSLNAQAQDRGTTQEAEAMVKKAIAHYKKIGSAVTGVKRAAGRIVSGFTAPLGPRA